MRFYAKLLVMLGLFWFAAKASHQTAVLAEIHRLEALRAQSAVPFLAANASAADHYAAAKQAQLCFYCTLRIGQLQD
ncbi:MAG: hypothetical protein ACTHLN_09335 [Tepidisphaeraceae bacterium]